MATADGCTTDRVEEMIAMAMAIAEDFGSA
jgi:hypothetical protein